MKLQILAALSLALSTNVAFAADAAAGKTAAGKCVSCHGANGVSTVATFPNLAGQKEAYLAKQLKAFKDGSRKDPMKMMNGQAAGLTDADMANLAAYYAGLK